MKIKIDRSELINNVLFWHNKTDEECIEMATNENGLDGTQARFYMIERDICTGIINGFVEDLKKYSEQK